MSQQAPLHPQQQPPNRHQTEVRWHFAVPVYSKQVPEAEQHRQALIDTIENYKIQRPPVQRSNQGGAWHSDTDFHLQDSEHIKWLNRHIGDMVKDCVMSFTPNLKNFDIVMNTCWANICEYGGWNAPHNHFPSQWSGVYYVSVEDSLNKQDEMDKAGKIEFLNPIYIAGSYGMPSGITYGPANGKMLIFPAILQHMVHPSFSHAKRYSIAFNMNVVQRN